MLVITLITSASYPLDQAFIDIFKTSLSAYSLHRVEELAPQEAYDFFIQDTDLTRLKAFCEKTIGDKPYDICIQPTENRLKKLLLSDMDSTIIGQECIDELAAAIGLKEKVSAITEKAMRGELDFESALTERVRLLQGLPESTLTQVYTQAITLNAGAKTLVQTMKSLGAYTVLVSGGFTFFTEKIAALTGFDTHRANILAFENGVLTGQVVHPILGKAAKLEQLHTFSRLLELPQSLTLAVGDGANDLAMIEAAGLGVAFYAKPAVCQQAHCAIRYSDLTALLFMQGIHKKAFVI